MEYTDLYLDRLGGYGLGCVHVSVCLSLNCLYDPDHMVDIKISRIF